MADDHWMEQAFPKKNKGKLHEQLGVPTNQTIPAKKLNAATKGRFGDLARKRAQAAKNAQAANR